MTNPGKVVKPRQFRARQTRQKILDATLQLLEDGPIEEISINRIARHADVNIASVYQYFPNKYAIVHELARAFGQMQADLICIYLAEADADSSIEEICEGMVDVVIGRIRGGRALVHLQRSLIASPALLQDYRATNLEIGQAIKPFLQTWGIDFDDAQVETSMLCLGEVFSAMQDLALSRDPNYDQTIVAELKRILASYYRSWAQQAQC